VPNLHKKDIRISISAIKAENIFWPGIDSGMYKLNCNSIAPKILPYPVDVDAVIVANGLTHRHRLRDYMNRYNRLRMFSAGVIFPNLIVAADNVHIRGSIVTIGGKFLLNGPSGLRMINRLSRANNENRVHKLQRIVESFSKIRVTNDLNLPLSPPQDLDLDFIIVAKNFFNFYHFTKETLPNLTLYQDYNLTGKIIIHSKNPMEASFVREEISLFFPELADRIIISTGDLQASRALLSIDARLLYYQTSESCMPSLGSIAKESSMWEDRVLAERNLKTLGMNSCESSLIALRERVLQRIEAMRHEEVLPKKRLRLYVARRPGKRLRKVKQESLLIEALEKLDFKIIYFEDYDVLTQAKLVSNSEVIVMAHGAGATNMLYAQPECLVIEISNLQVALLRFGDFNPLALASKARYLHFFTDLDWPNQENIPNFKRDGLIGSKLDKSGISILRSLIIAHLNPARHSEIKSIAARLNDEGNYEVLEDFLLVNFDTILHISDAHVWAANCAEFRSKSEDALMHLVQATRLAPQHRNLLERALILAHRLNAKHEFESFSFGYFRYHRGAAIKFFTNYGWDTNPYLDALN